MNRHAAVWIDHKQARIFHIHPDTIDELTVHAPLHDIHKHPNGPEGIKERPDDAKRFFREVARSLRATDAVLVVGPSTAKLEFLRYVHKNDQTLEPKIGRVETVDHPSNRQIVAYARKYFKLSDRIPPQ